MSAIEQITDQTSLFQWLRRQLGEGDTKRNIPDALIEDVDEIIESASHQSFWLFPGSRRDLVRAVRSRGAELSDKTCRRRWDEALFFYTVIGHFADDIRENEIEISAIGILFALLQDVPHASSPFAHPSCGYAVQARCTVELFTTYGKYGNLL